MGRRDHPRRLRPGPRSTALPWGYLMVSESRCMVCGELFQGVHGLCEDGAGLVSPQLMQISLSWIMYNGHMRHPHVREVKRTASKSMKITITGPRAQPHPQYSRRLCAVCTVVKRTSHSPHTSWRRWGLALEPPGARAGRVRARLPLGPGK